MAAAIPDDFAKWLSDKLQELNTDETVFGSYIQGILDSDETLEEKKEALEGILSEILENEEEISKNCNEILDKWQFFKPKEPPPKALSSEDMNVKLAKLLESQTLATTKQKQYTEDEKKIREAILSQYSQMTDSEEDDEGEEGAGEPKEKLEKNLNAQTVMQAEKLKREQAKIDSQKKKEKDKEDREKQKQMKEEKKEKRKTMKGERRR